MLFRSNHNNKPYEMHESIRNIARQKLSEKGVEASDQNLDTIEAALIAKGGNVPEVEMLDAEVQESKSHCSPHHLQH